MNEFLSVAGYGVDKPTMVFLLNEEGVTVTVSMKNQRAGEEDIREWRSYFHDSPTWKEHHLKTDSPLSSVFSGAYNTVVRHELTEETEPLYMEMIDSLKRQGATRTAFIAHA